MQKDKHRTISKDAKRNGAALLFVLFIISIVTLMVVNVLDATTLELAALRNSMDYERALHLCSAGVQEAAAQLEMDINWRGTITDGAFPADNTYEVTAVDGVDSTVTITSQGVSGDVLRTVEATLEL